MSASSASSGQSSTQAAGSDQQFNRFITVARWEGWSYLALFGVAMPLKYGAGQAWAVSIVGAIHGVLFTAFCLWLLLAWREQGWSMKTNLGCFIASLLPFGTMVMERKLLAGRAS